MLLSWTWATVTEKNVFVWGHCFHSHRNHIDLLLWSKLSSDSLITVAIKGNWAPRVVKIEINNIIFCGIRKSGVDQRLDMGCGWVYDAKAVEVFIIL